MIDVNRLNKLSENTKFFNEYSNKPYNMAVYSDSPYMYNINLDLHNFARHGVTRPALLESNGEKIDVIYNTKFLQTSLGEQQAQTLGELYYSIGSVINMKDPILKKIRMHYIDAQDDNSIEVACKQYGNFILRPAKVYNPEETNGYLNAVCHHTPNRYNNLYNSLERIENPEFMGNFHWKYIQKNVVDLINIYDPSSVAANLYFQRKKALIEGWQNITKIEGYDDIISGIATLYCNPHEFQGKTEILRMICLEYGPMGHHLYPGLLFPMFYFSMNFSAWSKLQVVIFIKDHFLVFVKSILFKIETAHVIIPDTMKKVISRSYGFWLRLNNYKLFSVLTINTTIMSDLVSEFKSLLCSHLPNDNDDNRNIVEDQHKEMLKKMKEENLSKRKARLKNIKQISNENFRNC